MYVEFQITGGCNGLKTLIFHGDAFEKLGPYMSDSVVKSNPIGSMGLFYFPETVNNIVVRLNGFFTFSIALLCVIFILHQQNYSLGDAIPGHRFLQQIDVWRHGEPPRYRCNAASPPF